VRSYRLPRIKRSRQRLAKRARNQRSRWLLRVEGRARGPAQTPKGTKSAK
jgi:hypothetical protein